MTSLFPWASVLGVGGKGLSETHKFYTVEAQGNQ